LAKGIKIDTVDQYNKELQVYIP